MKRQAAMDIPLDRFSEEVIFAILDFVAENPVDVKSFSITSKYFHSLEARHRKVLRPLRVEYLPRLLIRYPNVSHLDFTFCPRVEDKYLSVIAKACEASLKSLDLSRSRFFSSDALMSLAQNCMNLAALDLSNATWLRDSAAAAIAACKNLERLWLCRCNLITDIGVGCIAVGCKKLRLICLKWCLGISDLGVELVAIKCKEIRILDLSYLPITNKCLSSVLKLQHLEDLIVEGCCVIDDNSVADIKYGCKSLKKLDISSCQNISDIALSSFISRVESVQQLTLSYGPPVTLPLVECLKSLTCLQSIKLDGCTATDHGLIAIGNLCISLQELSLSKCRGVSDDALSFLVNKHRDLKKLDITCCRKITDACVANITACCANLSSLRMESCSLVSRDAFVLIGHRCKLLEELDLTDNEIDDEGLKSISGCARLLSVKLGICLNIGDAGIAAIGRSCANLIELDLYRSAGVSDLGISSIGRGCPNTEMINISYCSSVTDASLISLSTCSKMKILECRGCAKITSFGLAAVAVGCKQLRRLDIKQCQNVDNTGMISLGQFSQNLRQIHMSHTSVTDVGLLSLANISCLQSLTALHTAGLTPNGVAAALLACGGLRKAKLHSSFKASIPRPVHDHLQARGCVFEWRDKELQAELDPKCWKLQLADASQ